tara:strand:- start:2028 stop:2204 length:177 start_codon:yes stop_codon:yes gene_type:complete
MDRLESIQNERAMWRKTVMTNVGLIKKLGEEIAKLKKQIVDAEKKMEELKNGKTSENS